MAQKTIRLLMPQWQGGNLAAYHLGARLLNWLAPETSDVTLTVPVEEPGETGPESENGIVARAALLRQADAAASLLMDHAPDRIVVFGGDCLVDLAPFAYLNERCDGDLAVLWVDSHPDVLTPEHYSHAHAMVLGNLLGEGDPDFAGRVARPLKAGNVMYAGLFDMMPFERAFIERHGLRFATPTELAGSSEAVLDWFRSTGARHLAIHLDLDVLDPRLFRSLYFANPTDAPGAFGPIPQGRMTIEQVVRLLTDIADIADVVGLGITEHLPWDAIALKTMLGSLPLVGTSRLRKFTPSVANFRL